MPTAILFALCLLFGGRCTYHPAARMTEYVPAAGGINCMEPCNITASMEPVQYGLTAACGPNIPFHTRVYTKATGWRTCHDRGGLIGDDEVDVAVLPADYLQHGFDGQHPTLWVLPRMAVKASITPGD